MERKKAFDKVRADDQDENKKGKVPVIQISKFLSFFNHMILPKGTSIKICNEGGNMMVLFEPKDEEPKFKKGDVVFLNVQGDNKNIIITKSIYGNRHHVYVDFCINENELYSRYEDMWFSKEDIKYIRYATDEERRHQFLAMLNEGLFWDSESEDVKILKDGDIISVSRNRRECKK